MTTHEKLRLLTTHEKLRLLTTHMQTRLMTTHEKLRLLTTHEKLETTDDTSGPISESWNRSSHRRRSIVTSASTDCPGPMTHINGPRTTVASNIFSIITKLYPLHTRICITSAPCRRHQVQAAQVSARIVGPQYELASYHPSGAKNFRKICEPLHQSADHKRLTR